MNLLSAVRGFNVGAQVCVVVQVGSMGGALVVTVAHSESAHMTGYTKGPQTVRQSAKSLAYTTGCVGDMLSATKFSTYDGLHAEFAVGGKRLGVQVCVVGSSDGAFVVV